MVRGGSGGHGGGTGSLPALKKELLVRGGSAPSGEQRRQQVDRVQHRVLGRPNELAERPVGHVPWHVHHTVGNRVENTIACFRPAPCAGPGGQPLRRPSVPVAAHERLWRALGARAPTASGVGWMDGPPATARGSADLRQETREPGAHHSPDHRRRDRAESSDRHRQLRRKPAGQPVRRPSPSEWCSDDHRVSFGWLF